MIHWLLAILIPSLLVAEPDYDHFYATYGHAALRVQCPEMGTDFVFNQVGEKMHNRWLMYAAGELKMGMQVMETDSFIAHERGTIVEYPLFLPDSVTWALCAILERERQRGYEDRYDPLNGGCCQMMLRYVNEAAAMMHWPIRYSFGEEYDLSIRELNYLHSTHTPWTAVMLNTLSGTKADKRAISNMRKVIYPEQLVQLWQKAGVLSESCIKKTEHPGRPFPLPPVSVGILFILLCVTSWFPSIGQWMNYVLLGLITLVGLFLLYLWVGSTWPLAGWNWLLLVCNPLMAALWHWRRYWALPYACALAVLLLWTMLFRQVVMIPFYQLITTGIIIWLWSFLPLKTLK